MKRIASLSSLLAATVLAGSAAAQQYPTRNVSMIVPYAAGGPTDTVARVTAQAMGKPLGQTVIVENRPSAGGILGPEQVKNAKPDGYTILIHHIGMATTPTLYIKTNKDKVSYANAGIGAASHLCGMLFMSAIQTDFLTVPYKGTAPAMNDLLGGQVDFMCDQTTNTTSQIKSGKVRAYAVTSAKRVPSLPDVPTLQEVGVKNAEVGIWHGLYAPKGTPKPVIDKLVSSLQEALKDEGVQKRFADLGATTVPVSQQNPAALQKHLKAEIDKWAPLIKKAGQYAD